MRDAEIMSALIISATMIGMNVGGVPLAQNEHGC